MESTIPITIPIIHTALKGLPYTVRFDPTIESIRQYAQENQMVYVFIFLTGEITPDMQDWSPDKNTWLYEYGARVVQPFYLGGLDKPLDIAEQFINQMMGTHKYMVE